MTLFLICLCNLSKFDDSKKSYKNMAQIVKQILKIFFFKSVLRVNFAAKRI